jgi:hypothetical protein
MSIDKIICPKCGTENAISFNNCSSCGLSLIIVRDALNASNSKQEEIKTSPIPSMPELPAFPSYRRELGNFIDSHTSLINDMGARADEIRARFCTKLIEMKIYVGTGIIGNQNFLFVFIPINGVESYTIMAIRIEPQEGKLLIEHRRYVKVTNSFGALAWIWIIIFALITYGLTLLLLFIKGYREFLYKLGGGRTQETQVLMSQTHQVTVLSVLADALKASGMHEMISLL